MKRLFFLVAVFAALLFPLPASPATVKVAEIHGAVSPASAAYFLRALEVAQRARADLLVLKLDTPGGLDSSMREMIQGILASPVPVAVWVAPSGARAASAGTYLIYASHVAVMAPGTNLGAATPVAIGIGGAKPGEEKAEKGKSEEKSEGKGEEKSETRSGSAMERKSIHDASAYIRSLAQLRGRNAEWAERAVRQAESLSAEEALKQNVVDLVAADLPALLRAAEGRKVTVGSGEITLAFTAAAVEAVEHNWKERLLAAIADPNIALILMMLGVYGLLFEFYTPGFGVSGIIGSICLLLAFYALAMLPVNAVGALLLMLGMALMVTEAFLPSFGAFGIGGIVAFVAGALMLIDGDVPGLQISMAFIVPLAAVSAVVLGGAGALALRARRRPSVSGVEAMIGTTAVALEAFEDEGWVRAGGACWWAQSSAPVASGDRVRIAAVEGLLLVVEPEGEGERK